MPEDRTHAWAPNICPSCGRPNRPQARFCSFCGAALRPLPRAARPAAAPAGPMGGVWAIVLSVILALMAWALAAESIAFETFYESVGSSVLLALSAMVFVFGVFAGTKGKTRELLPNWFPYLPVLLTLMAVASLGVAMGMPEPEWGGERIWNRRVGNVAIAGLIFGGFLVLVLVCMSVYISKRIRGKEGKLDIRLSPSWLPWVAPSIAALGGMLMGFGIAGNSEELGALAFFFWTGAVMVWAAVRELYKREARSMGRHPIPILAEVPLLLCLAGFLIGMGALALAHSHEAIVTCIKIIGAWGSGVLPSAQLYSCVAFWDWARGAG